MILLSLHARYNAPEYIHDHGPPSGRSWLDLSQILHPIILSCPRSVSTGTLPYSRLCMPPATTIVSPVTYAASSDARYATQAAMSPGVPNLFRKVRSLFAAAISGVSTRAAANFVGTVPAAALSG